MRNFILVLIAAVAVALTAPAVTAQAMPLPGTSAIKGAAAAIDVTEDVACWRAWRCSPYYGCGWRLVCTRPYYSPYVYRPYPLYRPYWGYRPYYRPYWSYRPWGYRHWGYRRHWW